MPQLIKKFACNHCNQQFNELGLAEKCETKCKNKQLAEEKQKRLQKCFPTRHKTDNRYNKHCVKCGSIILRYDCVNEYHRNEVGELLKENPHKFIIGGRYCLPCFDKTTDWLIDLITKELSSE